MNSIGEQTRPPIEIATGFCIPIARGTRKIDETKILKKHSWLTGGILVQIVANAQKSGK